MVRKYRFSALLLSLLLLSAAPLFGAAGDLDCSFGNGGWTRTDFGGHNHAHDVALQSDGKIVVIDGARLIRYTSDGSLDATFGTNGSVPLGLPGGAFAFVIAVDASDRIVVMGRIGSQDVIVGRHLAGGGLDPAFGSGGYTTFEFATAGWLDFPSDMAIDFAGRIVVGG
ncbi:MAG: hypothetical protein ACRD2J_14425, partial [Thermoanaerobaculia bacterium]